MFNFTPQLIKTSINHKTKEKHVWKGLVLISKTSKAVPKNRKKRKRRRRKTEEKRGCEMKVVN